jgi:hypothetical protein
MTMFFRVLDEAVEQKASKLQRMVVALRQGQHAATELDPAAFSAVPGSPFAYWASDEVRAVFQRFEKFESHGRSVRQGLATADDFRFLRAWWEVTPKGAGWFGFAKGGSFSPFYADVHLCVNWVNDGAEIKNNLNAQGAVRSNVWMLRDTAANYFFRPGLTWPLRSRRFAPQPLPSGCIFSVRGYSAFTADEALLATLAVFNSSCFDFLFKTFLGRFGFPEFIVGILQQMPWAEPDGELRRTTTAFAHRAWSLKRSLDTANEASHAFLVPAAVNKIDRDAVVRELALIQKKIDHEAFLLYGIGADDRTAIECSGTAETLDADDTNETDEEADESGDEDTESGADETGAFASWLVGVAFGRFDPRLATGERSIPPEPEPFDPLPSRSPGMYPEGEEPADRPDILVDDEGHADDLAARAIDVAKRVKVDAPENLRAWLAEEFFTLHIRMYSKSRRKAPIYWQLATPSAGYSVWLYIHAVSKDTLFRVQNDYIGGERGKLAHEERRLESLTSELRDGASAAQRKTVAAQEAVVDELRAFLDEVKRVAPLWNPNLDDGVIINFAPLWRIVPQNKAWQKELKSTWDALAEGKYDWAHLAMHLWPERVVPKCAKDRSLAIAHGIEDVFWVEGTGGKWTTHKTPTRSVDELVRERTSPAVKSALKSLLEAPAVAGKSGGRRGGGRRKGAAAAEGGDA